MSLKTSYRFIAPIYDIFLKHATLAARQRSLAKLNQHKNLEILINGVGTGLDFPFLPAQHQYTALDLTPAMLHRSLHKAPHLTVRHLQGDVMALPINSAQFDVVILHLILAVVPHPERCLAEAARVLKPGGRILIFDKFLHRGQRAWLRRGLNLIVSQLATRLDVVFEDVLVNTKELTLISDEPALANGWFRLIELQKNAS